MRLRPLHISAKKNKIVEKIGEIATVTGDLAYECCVLTNFFPN